MCQPINSVIYILNSQKPSSALCFSPPQNQEQGQLPKIPKPLRRPQKTRQARAYKRAKQASNRLISLPQRIEVKNHRYNNTSKRTVSHSVTSLFPLPLSPSPSLEKPVQANVSCRAEKKKKTILPLLKIPSPRWYPARLSSASLFLPRDGRVGGSLLLSETKRKGGSFFAHTQKPKPTPHPLSTPSF